VIGDANLKDSQQVRSIFYNQCKVKMMNKILLRRRDVLPGLSALALTASLLLAGVSACLDVALATPPVGFTSVPVPLGSPGFGTFDDPIKVQNAGEAMVTIRTKDSVDVHNLVNTFVPGGMIGWHSHPGPSIVTVRQGTASVYHADDPTCTPTLYETGSGFIDTGDDVHNVRNEGTVDLILVVVSIVPEGAPRRIDEPKPDNCPF
jgi:quercetin dioxygenase-like cupin family protein